MNGFMTEAYKRLYDKHKEGGATRRGRHKTQDFGNGLRRALTPTMMLSSPRMPIYTVAAN